MPHPVECPGLAHSSGRLEISVRLIVDAAWCLESYFGAEGTVEEWWSTMSQSLPRFTYVTL
jgi:hypothetical protein